MTTQRSRRPRPHLDRDAILDAVLRIAARRRGDPLSVRTLGKELGADPTAIYRHFTGMDDLVRAALDRLFEDVNRSVPQRLSWRRRLRVAAELTLDRLTEHPAVGARAATVTTGAEAELRAVEIMLAAFREAGLTDRDAVRYYAMFSSYVLAFSAAQASALLEPHDGDDDRWLADYSLVDPERYPAVAALQPVLDRLQDREVYLTGVDLILESAATRAAAVRRTRTRGSSGR